jgi:photosystem II stability/assembly factor-like uncharacterized protein
VSIANYFRYIKHIDNVKYIEFTRLKTRIFVIGLILLLSLSTSIIPTYQVAASSNAVKWSKVNIPTEGGTGNWVLADSSDIHHLTMASDGTLYAHIKGLTYTLYQSTDSGVSWSHIGDVQDTIVDIATSPINASNIYYATPSAIYRSTDGGETFHSLSNPGGAGTNNIEITSIDVARLNNDIVAIGTRDTDISEFGGVYTLDETNMLYGWTDTNLGNYDVYAVAFSPDYAANPQLVAVMTDETDTFTASKIGDSGWSAFINDARLNKDNLGTYNSVAVATSAAIAFPSNYNVDIFSVSCVYFIAIDTGTGEGDAYKIIGARTPYNSSAIDLNMGSAYGLNNIDVTGLAACGDTPGVTLLAGTADSAQTFLSTDGGSSWIKSSKEPTGDSQTYVLMAPDFNDTGMAFTGTSGHGSALSISRDNGGTWNQLSLIDTDISAIVDLAPSPNYSQDKILFMLTFGSGHSLWRSQDGGDSWERIFASALADVDSITMVGLPPQYDDDSQTVFVAGESNSRPTIWESTDNGQNYRRRLTRDPTTNDAFPIDTWVIVDETTLFIGSHDGNNGRVYNTTNSGFFYSSRALAGSQPLNSLALSPDYQQDETILLGNSNGWVYWSEDNGKSFKPLPANTSSPPLTGSITVAFDPKFDSNNTVYAASDTVNSGIYRFVIGSSDDWERVDNTLPAGATLNQLTVAKYGTLYAANSDADGGMERCLNPTYSFGPTFETVTRNLSDDAALYGLWQSDHRLWSIDTNNIRLVTFYDTMTTPVTLVSPENKASGIGNLIDHTIRNINLDWETLNGATSYQWQCDYDTDFSSVPEGLEDTTQASSAHLPFLEPATTYYCRVRARAPVHSPWSKRWSFTTSPDMDTITLRLESPAAGASDVPVKPIFQWTAVASADAYELLVSTNDDFSSPVITKNDDGVISTNAWQCDVSLDYDTTYYWKIRAINTSTLGSWSASGAFTTEAPPTEEPTGQVAEITLPTPIQFPEITAEPPPSDTSTIPPDTPSPTPPSESAPPPQDAPQSSDMTQSTSIPNWVLYLIGALVLTIMLALATILTIIMRMRRF